MSSDVIGTSRPAGLSRRQIVLGCTLLVAGPVSEYLRPRNAQRPGVPKGSRITLPTRCGAWNVRDTGDIILPDANATTGLYDQIEAKAYEASGLPQVMLMVAYGGLQTGPHRLHRPEDCYDAAGFRIHDHMRQDIPITARATIPAQSFIASRPDRDEVVLYWTRVGEAFPNSLAGQTRLTEQAALKGNIPDGILVRFSIASEHGADMSRYFKQFAEAFYLGSDEVTRKLIGGEQVAKLVSVGI